jgi:hypothetical protein
MFAGLKGHADLFAVADSRPNPVSE